MWSATSDTPWAGLTQPARNGARSSRPSARPNHQSSKRSRAAHFPSPTRRSKPSLVQTASSSKCKPLARRPRVHPPNPESPRSKHRRCGSSLRAVTERSSTDVLVVGGGPAGCSAAIRLAAMGHQVTVLERSGGESPVARGDLLVPAAVDELVDLGLNLNALGGNAITGSRLWHGGRSVPVRWPDTR
ncbi:MAG: FAD-dependent oxidoreductase, partial [Ilumatobacter sp.]|nr:FAD-dependent oxidoreductase [Ilumatobacter sp.]